MEIDDEVEKLSGFLYTISELYTSNNSCFKSAVNSKEQCFSNSAVVEYSENELQNLYDCVRENKNCYSLLNVIESSINLLLDNCLKDQKLVKAEIDVHLRKQSIDSSCSGREYRMRHLLRVPYFKDTSGFSHPHNEDSIKRNNLGFLNHHNRVVPALWNEQEKNVLMQCIRKVEEEKWTETLKSCHMLHMANVKQMSLKELVESRYSEYDWFHFSVTSLKNSHSPGECRALWFTCLHPQINKQAWTEEENEKLRIIVKKFKWQDWERIAEELGTKRSALQCIEHFKMQLCIQNKSQWSDSEVMLLKQLVQMFRHKGFIPWCKLRMFMNGQSLKDILQMWDKINNEGKPQTFSLEEDIVLVAGMKLFGNNYSRIQDYLPDRSPRQVRKRIEVLKGRQFFKQPWATQEDELLKNLVDNYGYGNWLKISCHFVNRNPSALRSRYVTLQKHKNEKSCASIALRTPMRSTGIVNVTSLWECAQRICHENNICCGLDTAEKNPSVNIAYELSRILNPQMCSQNTIAKTKFKEYLDREYFKLFSGTCLPTSNQKKFHKNKKNIQSLAHSVIMALKLLEAKINIPFVEEIEKDSVISAQDMFLLKYLVNYLLPKTEIFCDIFLPNSELKHDIIAEENTIENSNKIWCAFPPNLATLTATRSLHLNSHNLKDQNKELTAPLNNFEQRDVNTYFSTSPSHLEKNHIASNKLWNERLFKLLGSVSVMLNKDDI